MRDKINGAICLKMAPFGKVRAKRDYTRTLDATFDLFGWFWSVVFLCPCCKFQCCWLPNYNFIRPFNSSIVFNRSLIKLIDFENVLILNLFWSIEIGIRYSVSPFFLVLEMILQFVYHY